MREMPGGAACEKKGCPLSRVAVSVVAEAWTLWLMDSGGLKPAWREPGGSLSGGMNPPAKSMEEKPLRGYLKNRLIVSRCVPRKIVRMFLGNAKQIAFSPN